MLTQIFSALISTDIGAAVFVLGVLVSLLASIVAVAVVTDITEDGGRHG